MLRQQDNIFGQYAPWIAEFDVEYEGYWAKEGRRGEVSLLPDGL
ncbi:PPE family protein [Mycobacterium leprae]|nr:PPE family protein [Mycobacterium leprae]